MVSVELLQMFVMKQITDVFFSFLKVFHNRLRIIFSQVIKVRCLNKRLYELFL